MDETINKENVNLLNHIMDIKESLPKKQKFLCNFILENHKDIGIYTVKELAEAAGVGTTTVMRLTKLLGYETYIDFRKDIHYLQNEYLNKWESVKSSFEREIGDSSSNNLQWIIQRATNNIQKILDPLIIVEYEKIISILINANKIHVFGARPYRAAAIYFDIIITEFSDKMNQLSYDSETLFDRAQHFKSDDVLIVFSFEPYTNRTSSLVHLAASKNVKIILFTNQLSCPSAKYATSILTIPMETEFFSIVPLIVLLEAITVELGRNSEDAVHNIKNLVPILKKYEII